MTPYERAVCYYTLPKVIHPITLGLIWVYALCVIEAVGAFSYGVYTGDMDWTMAGFYSFAGRVRPATRGRMFSYARAAAAS